RLALPPDLGHGPGAAEGRRRGLPAEAPLALAGREGDRRELRAATLHALDRGRRQARSARGLPPPFACLCAAATGAARGLDGPVRESSWARMPDLTAAPAGCRVGAARPFPVCRTDSSRRL